MHDVMSETKLLETPERKFWKALLHKWNTDMFTLAAIYDAVKVPHPGATVGDCG